MNFSHRYHVFPLYGIVPLEDNTTFTEIQLNFVMYTVWVDLSMLEFKCFIAWYL